MNFIKLFITSIAIFVSVSNADAQPYTIYLTFDDGPLNGSERVFDAINKEGIPITVFVVGVHIDGGGKRKEYFQNYIVDSLIEVGNHSYSHAHNHYAAFYNNPKEAYEDFAKCYEKHGLPTKFCRLPGRNIWRTSKINHNDLPSGASTADLLYKNGFKVIGWDVEWQHDGKTSAPIQTVGDMYHLIDNMAKGKKAKTKKHVVVLCHDEMFAKDWEESELKQLIEKLKASGEYKFAFLSEYPKL